MNKRKAVNQVPAAMPCHGRPGECPACTVDYIVNGWDAKIWHDDATRDVVHSERKYVSPTDPKTDLPFDVARLRWIWFPSHQQKRFS